MGAPTADQASGSAVRSAPKVVMAMEGSPLLPHSTSAWHRRRITVAMTLILGILAVLALMGSPDGESAWQTTEASIKESERDAAGMNMWNAAQQLPKNVDS